jgi:hypothetical protein
MLLSSRKCPAARAGHVASQGIERLRQDDFSLNALSTSVRSSDAGTSPVVA